MRGDWHDDEPADRPAPFANRHLFPRLPKEFGSRVYSDGVITSRVTPIRSPGRLRQPVWRQMTPALATLLLAEFDDRFEIAETDLARDIALGADGFDVHLEQRGGVRTLR